MVSDFDPTDYTWYKYTGITFAVSGYNIDTLLIRDGCVLGLKNELTRYLLVSKRKPLIQYNVTVAQALKISNCVKVTYSGLRIQTIEQQKQRDSVLRKPKRDIEWYRKSIAVAEQNKRLAQFNIGNLQGCITVMLDGEQLYACAVRHVEPNHKIKYGIKFMYTPDKRITGLVYNMAFNADVHIDTALEQLGLQYNLQLTRVRT